jgi:hypothetical protein
MVMAMMKRKRSHMDNGMGNSRGIPRVAEEVATPLLLLKLRWKAKRDRTMAIKPLSKR